MVGAPGALPVCAVTTVIRLLDAPKPYVFSAFKLISYNVSPPLQPKPPIKIGDTVCAGTQGINSPFEIL